MAQGIIDCQGQVIKIGDKVRTEFGDVIDVCGGMVSEHRLFVSHNCTVVDPSTPITNTGHIVPGVTEVPHSMGAKTLDVQFDCVVWGT
jgi:hypothetical protein